MIEVRSEHGIHLPAEDFWLDPPRARELAFVSHAHSDHIARHREAILTAVTSRLMAARLGKSKRREHRLTYREPVRIRDFEIELLPAGHVLGSAQCLVTSAAGTLLYTGDFKLRRGLTGEPAAATHAETLVMETTFGRPRYVFPPADEVRRQIAGFCLAAREAGATPVLVTWSLGKAQEALAALAGLGLPVLMHRAAWEMTCIYREFGAEFPSFGKFEDAAAIRDHVVICPPGASLMAKIPVRRTAALTGWALDPRTTYRLGVDAAFPLSDHAGYDDLLRYVEMVSPRRVFTTHGFAQEFARDLRDRGVEAWSLGGVDQLEFSLRETKASRQGARGKSDDR